MTLLFDCALKSRLMKKYENAVSKTKIRRTRAYCSILQKLIVKFSMYSATEITKFLIFLLLFKQEQ